MACLGAAREAVAPFGRAASTMASDGLLVDCVRTIIEEMKQCTRKGRRRCSADLCKVHVQCPVLDKEEMLGYLLGDA